MPEIILGLVLKANQWGRSRVLSLIGSNKTIKLAFVTFPLSMQLKGVE